MLSDKEIDVGNTTANFNFDVTANFGYNNSQLDMEKEEKESVISKQNGDKSFKIQSFGEVPKIKSGEIGSSNFLAGGNLSDVQKQNSSDYDSKKKNEKLLVSEDHMPQLEKGMSVGREGDTLGADRPSTVEFGSLLFEGARAGKESKQDDFSEFGNMLNITDSRQGNKVPRGSQGDSQAQQKSGGSGVGNQNSQATYSFDSVKNKGKNDSEVDPDRRMSEITMKPLTDSSMANDISFQQDWTGRLAQQPLATGKEQFANFHKAVNEPSPVESHRSMENSNPEQLLLQSITETFVRNVADKIFKTPLDEQPGIGSFAKKPNMPNSSASVESTRGLLEKIVEARMQKTNIKSRAEMRTLNAELRRLELEEKRLNKRLDLIKKTKEMLLPRPTDTFGGGEQAAQRSAKFFENCVNKLENQNFADVFYEAKLNGHFGLNFGELGHKQTQAITFMRQEILLDKLLASNAEYRRLDHEFNQGNLYELMNEIEIKLHHYDFQSDDFMEIKETYLLRMQLERDLHELKRKGNELDELL